MYPHVVCAQFSQELPCSTSQPPLRPSTIPFFSTKLFPASNAAAVTVEYVYGKCAVPSMVDALAASMERHI